MTEATTSNTADERVADVAGVPDALLRSALELAVGIAAEGQKIRPPLVYPPALKPFLKVNRLDAAGLRSVRRAVSGDSSFRDRLALVDMTGLVDELGATWLARPDGWEDTVRRLVGDLQRQAADESAAVALRKSEKRREAAEAVAARAQAELIGHHDALARETARRERAEDTARAAVARADGLRDDNVGLQRELERLRVQNTAASDRAHRAEAAVAVLTEQLRAAEAMRDDLLARRSGAGDADVAPSGRSAARVADPAALERVTAELAASDADAVRATDDLAAARRRSAEAAAALQQASRATRDLAAALAAAGEALAETTGQTTGQTSPRTTALEGGDRTRPASAGNRPDPAFARAATGDRRVTAGLHDVKPLRSPPSRRKPIPIPGGLYGDSTAAAEHLLRVRDVCVLVDGYNVAKLAWPQLELADQRERCIEMLEDMTRRIGTDIRVVFDGAEVVGASSRRRLVRVQFSPPGVSADDVIRSEVAAIPSTVPAVVVTNDQAIVNDVRTAGVNVVSTDVLLCVAGRSRPR